MLFKQILGSVPWHGNYNANVCVAAIWQIPPQTNVQSQLALQIIF
jgi:hypothetical protein